ncbi:MAG TPA: D-ornithine 4,5-aminomutase subunit OraE [Synergistaceae bacterium]|nr:D-ornithine 4,5-aminomutase subunit OraE [Synergistaceae bacterium]HQF90694.1 D-ornithine 4,5-aminomutase subunit OraE [Synergistaceae bacterium]HQH78522.1 D-ornithine 4,5-aminomutase subunit OraE [Synergistaceae bacterium]HQK24677.1 D-ornithine 4,5-aminomutase subunit OraE [Synergistaceae bacterium]
MKLQPNKRLDIKELLKDLENYRPKRRGWHWREGRNEPRIVGDFEYHEASEGLTNYVPLPGSRGFHYIDPQPDCVITTEIASGRFEDDVRRMRMAAWHGADHIMVIRTAGQSHIDSLLEGTTQGIGGIAVTRKQVRASRKALDAIEEEVGRPINFHSYISGVAGPDIAVMFAEEGVNGAHQDPQYNVLYRNVNMVRSFVDACEAKKIMAWAGILQIDGAHNANATAMKAWKVRPELMVQHAINSIFSRKVGIKPENIALSTVPPTAPPAPCMRLDLPYAVALRDFFSEYKMRAQQNTKYMESDMREATVTHTLNLVISRLTSADVQSTITPDEGRNVPWHYNNIAAISTAKQALNGLDGLREMVKLDREGPLGVEVRELKERAVLFMEEMLEVGGYFKAVEQGFFIDSGYYPERNGDGIPRQADGGIGVGMLFERDKDYFAPVSVHYGYNNIPAEFGGKASAAIGGDTFEDPSKIVFIDELDENDNVDARLREQSRYYETEFIKPEVEWRADGVVALNLFLPVDERTAEFAAIRCGEKMGLEDVTVVHKQAMHPSEGTYVELKGRVNFDINVNDLVIPEKIPVLSEEEIREDIAANPLFVVAATVGQDEHSVGLKETLDIKHGGVEKFGIKYLYLGTSCPVEKLVDAAIETNAGAILASTIITHDDVHVRNMRKIHELCVEKGIRDKVTLICGGTQVSHEIAREAGMDAGFGRGTKGIDVASFMVKFRRGQA